MKFLVAVAILAFANSPAWATCVTDSQAIGLASEQLFAGYTGAKTTIPDEFFDYFNAGDFPESIDGIHTAFFSGRHMVDPQNGNHLFITTIDLSSVSATTLYISVSCTGELNFAVGYDQ